MSDPADLGSEREEIQRQEALNRVRYRTHADPLLNEEGERICRDCEELILLERMLAAPHAVRCVPCQKALEGS